MEEQNDIRNLPGMWGKLEWLDVGERRQCCSTNSYLLVNMRLPK